MHRSSIAVALTFLVSVSAYPCGDKLASMNRGVRLQRALASRQPAAIVIFSGPAMPAGAVRSLRTGLERAGHRIALAASGAELGTIVASGHRDLVIAAAADVPSVETSLSSLTSRPAVIRLLENPTRTQWKQESKRCPLVMRIPADNVEQLTAIDGAMTMRARKASAEGCVR